MTRLYYTSNTYDAENRTIEKDALVYLPYGYDQQSCDYNVFYLMHGGGGNSDEVFGGIHAATNLKRILDNMIENGDIPPTVVVAPSFYYHGTDKALRDKKEARDLTENFHHEFTHDLIPTVERNLRVKVGRSHRAFGGYSMGGEATWNIFLHCIDEVEYFLPMSGDCWIVEIMGGKTKPVETVDAMTQRLALQNRKPSDYKVFACVGDDGVAYPPVHSMMQTMQRSPYFIFAEDFSSGNLVYCIAHGGTHSYDYCYEYIYNALPHFFND